MSSREEIFVFGSNLAGRHGAGAALYARQNYFAQLGVGVGRTGKAYAIPTKDETLKVLPLHRIRVHVKQFLKYAETSPNCLFYVTAFGTGYAGYEVHEIKRLFEPMARVPYNVVFTKDWMNDESETRL